MRRGTSFANSRTISALSKVTLETFINSESFLRIHLGIKHCYNYSRSLKIHHVICRILWLYFLFDTSSLAPYIPKISRCSHGCGPILISKQKNKVTTPPQKKTNIDPENRNPKRKIIIIFQPSIFRCSVSFRESISNLDSGV